MTKSGRGPGSSGVRAPIAERDQALSRLSEETFDVLVIGGGITGAGVALDAATRGMKVALIEKGDFASGTSGKSSKLVHGGLRYLQYAELGLVREAARERNLLAANAPNLVSRIPFLWTDSAGARRSLASGLWLYDRLAGRGWKNHRRVGPDRIISLVPGAVLGLSGYVFYDAQTDDARLTLAVIRAAREAGAITANYVEATALLDGRGRIYGCMALDRARPSEISIKAKTVVNATGVWSEGVAALEGGPAGKLRPSKGIHLVLPHHRLPLRAACILPTGDGDYLLATPWRSSVLVGPTDTEYSGPLDRPWVTEEDVAFVLKALSRALKQEFTPEDVVAAYAGLRPLLAGKADRRTRDLSRRHAVSLGRKGLITVTGGKLTTFRSMAEEVVDLVSRRLGGSSRCQTAAIPIGGIDTEPLAWMVANQLQDLGLERWVGRSLIRSYGNAAPKILEIAQEMELCEPIVDGLPYLTAEIVWGIRQEMSLTVSDLLARRTRVSLEDRLGGLGSAGRLTNLIASELGVSSELVSRQFDVYGKELALERGPALSGRLSDRTKEGKPEPVGLRKAKSAGASSFDGPFDSLD